MLPKIAVIIVTYNSTSYIDEVLLSLERVDYPKEKLEIIVVDNASKDGTPEILRSKEGITFFSSGENLGFAAGNNLGINHALLDSVEYVYLLNPDAKMDQQALREVVALAEKDENVGSVQSRMMLWKHPKVLNSTGGMVHFLGFGFVRDNGREWEDVREKIQDGEEIAYASGAAVLYRASALRKVGLLDPYYFMYHEDLELGWRLRLAGYKNVLATKSVVYHDYEFSRSIKKFYWMERNRVIVHCSHLKWKTLLLLGPLMTLMELALFAFALKGGWIKEKVLVCVDLMRPGTWKHIMKKRRESTLIRAVPDKEIVRLFTGSISHQETNNPVVERIANPALTVVWIILKSIIRW